MRFEDWGVIDYADALAKQQELFDALIAGKEGAGTVVFCEHPHVYTLGKSGRVENLLVGEAALRERGAGFYRIDRGGDITYHGPGQIVVYPIVDLEKTGLGLREYVAALELSVIETLAEFGIRAGRVEGKTGVWIEELRVESGELREARKICAIGIRASRGVVMHGLALNVATDLGWFDLINPCGFRGARVTSMSAELERKVPEREVKETLREKIKKNIENHVNGKEMDCSPRGQSGGGGGPGCRAETLARAGEPARAARHHDPPRGRKVF